MGFKGPFYKASFTVQNFAAVFEWPSDDESVSATVRNLIAENTITGGDTVRVETIGDEYGPLTVVGVDSPNIWCRSPRPDPTPDSISPWLYWTVDASLAAVTLIEKAER